MIQCDKCKAEIGHVGFPDVIVAVKPGAVLCTSFSVSENDDVCQAPDSVAFCDDLLGDWCQPCARTKLLDLLNSV